MSYTTPSVPDFLDQLEDALKAEFPLVDIVQGIDNETPEHDRIEIVRVSFEYEQPTMKAGRLERDERFIVSLYLYSVKPGGTTREAKAQVYEFATAIDDMLANKGFADFLYVGASEGTLELAYTTAGAEAAMLYSIAVETRLY